MSSLNKVMNLRWLVLCLIFAGSVEVALCSKNGLALTPPMGFLSWERFRCNIDCENDPENCISEKLYKAMADRLVADGYKAVGYEYVNIDDCWPAASRDGNGRLVPDPVRFPSGIKGLADYMHARGLKLGIYSAWSNYTCAGYLGSYGHAQIDAQTFADWGVDSLKLDGCTSDTSIYASGYPEMGLALNKTGRQILYSCSWPAYVDLNTFNWTEIVQLCNLWRLYDDIQDSWTSMFHIAQFWGKFQAVLQPLAGPGNWNDPDMIIVGDFSLSIGEAQVQFALWAILAAPLYLSVDLRTIRPEFKEILLNKEIIDVNQDPLGIQGRILGDPGADTQVWARPLSKGDVAVALVYSGDDGTPHRISFKLKDVGIKSGVASIRDLFTHKDLGLFVNSFSTLVNPHGVVMIRLTPHK